MRIWHATHNRAVFWWHFISFNVNTTTALCKQIWTWLLVPTIHNRKRDKVVEQNRCSKITFLTLTITIILQKKPVIRICWSASCHCTTTSTFHVRKLSIISSNVFINACHSNFSKKWNIYRNKIKTMCFYLAVTA